jgi:hypothetical protein
MRSAFASRTAAHAKEVGPVELHLAPGLFVYKSKEVQ